MCLARIKVGALLGSLQTSICIILKIVILSFFFCQTVIFRQNYFKNFQPNYSWLIACQYHGKLLYYGQYRLTSTKLTRVDRLWYYLRSAK